LNAADKRTYIDTFLTPGKKMIGQIFKTQAQYFDSVVNDFRSPIALKAAQDGKVGLKRAMAANKFSPTTANRVLTRQDIPFVTNGCFTTLGFLKDTLRRNLAYVTYAYGGNVYNLDEEDGDIGRITINKWNKIHSQPTDSLLKPMMHRSDNFFAEQSLLMVSNERLGIMNDAKIIDTLLKTDFKDLPQKPRWVDGSGLSRYNLFTPQDLVAIFNKMKNDFGMDRIKNILPTGGEGTFSSYYKSEAGYLFAKTGTLSGVVAISGFLYTKKNKLLIFSVLVNNHNASATDVRRAVEKFIEAVRNKY
jgi:D-alanyl-D-alanine carboxypeptidase/D-alanyl-D-alanine-endopeptidase (penicillin-binding protein 4)